MAMRIKLKDPAKIRELLIRKGLSKSRLSKHLKVSIPYTIQVTNGDRSPGPELARRICEVFEVEFDDIFYIHNA